VLNNVKEFGAQGDGATDDRERIQAAVSDAVARGLAGVFFPAGTYRVSRSLAAGARWSVDLSEANDFVVAGEGPRSVVQLMDTTSATGDWHVFILRRGCRRVVFTDLVIDGNRQGLRAPDEQSHGIEVEAGTEDLVIDRCTLRNCHGDGVRLLGQGGANAAPVKRVRITNSAFIANKRSGIGVQRAVQRLIVSHCQFEGTATDSDIDFEPSGSLAPAEVLIQGCVIKHANAAVAVSLSGISGPDPLVDARFSDNLLTGGELFCTDVARLAIQNNTIVAPETPGRNRIPVQVQRGGDAVVIAGNTIVQDGLATEAAVSLSEVNKRQVSRALVQGNLILARAGHGVSCLSGDDVSVDNNLVVATGAAGAGVFIRSEASPCSGISIRGNDIAVRGDGNWQAGVRLVATEAQGIGDVSIVGNAIRRAEGGVVFDGSNYCSTPVCALNRTDSGVAAALVGVNRLPERAVVVGGAVGSPLAGAQFGGGRQLAGRGDPNGSVAGHPGDLFHRMDGSVGTCLYVKEAGAGTNTGWSAK
jgi:hypothetical protein